MLTVGSGVLSPKRTLCIMLLLLGKAAEFIESAQWQVA